MIQNTLMTVMITQREYDSKYSDDSYDKQREYEIQNTLMTVMINKENMIQNTLMTVMATTNIYDSKYFDASYDMKYSDKKHDYNYRD